MSIFFSYCHYLYIKGEDVRDGVEGGHKQRNDDYKTVMLKQREIVRAALTMVNPHQRKGTPSKVISKHVLKVGIEGRRYNYTYTTS